MCDDSPENVRRLAFLRGLLGPELTEAGEEIRLATNFELSSEERTPWYTFVEWTNTQPAFVQAWRAEAGQPRYHRFAAAIMDSRYAYTAALYHLKRIEDLEATISGILARHDFSALPEGTVCSLSSTNLADFEYHSFVFAYRRCLDYLAWGFSTFFDARTNSYRQFGERVAKWTPAEVAVALEQSYLRHAHHFSFVMAKERGKSLRDRIAHKRFVQAFNVSITRSSFRLVGGGEGLGIGDRVDDRSLSRVLRERLGHLHGAVADMLDTFRSAVSASDRAS